MLSTADEVEKLQEELETMQPLLAQAAEETVETMEKIKVDSVRIHLPFLTLPVIHVNHRQASSVGRTSVCRAEGRGFQSLLAVLNSLSKFKGSRHRAVS